MPVIKCSNGKYRIGSGDCIYETEAAAQRAYRGYLADKSNRGIRVSFDYDGVLSTIQGRLKAMKEKAEGKVVYIISASRSRAAVMAAAREIGVPESRVFIVGSNRQKVDKIKELAIHEHYDDNPDVDKEHGY